MWRVWLGLAVLRKSVGGLNAKAFRTDMTVPITSYTATFKPDMRLKWSCLPPYFAERRFFFPIRQLHLFAEFKCTHKSPPYSCNDIHQLTWRAIKYQAFNERLNHGDILADLERDNDRRFGGYLSTWQSKLREVFGSNIDYTVDLQSTPSFNFFLCYVVSF